jgi:hypothetical protein
MSRSTRRQPSVSPWWSRATAQPDAGRGEHLRRQAGLRAHLTGLLDGGQRVAVETQVRVRHREVVPAPRGLGVGVRHRRQRPGRLHQMGHATVQIALQVRAEGGERVHLAAQIGVRHLPDGRRRRGHRAGELGHPAQVDQRAEPLDQRVRPGQRIGGAVQHPLQDRQRLGRPAALLQPPRVAQLIDMVRELVQPTQQRASHPAGRRRTRRFMIMP